MKCHCEGDGWVDDGGWFGFRTDCTRYWHLWFKVYKYRIGSGLHKYIWWSLKVFALSSGQIVKCQWVVIRSWI